MSENSDSYPTPLRPMSFREVVQKILDDAEYAKFIHGEVVKARKGDKAALETVTAHFKMLPDELKDLDLPSNFGSCPNCTDTNTNLFVLEFATPARLWH